MIRSVVLAVAMLASHVVFTIDDPRIDEASAMVDLGALTVVTNDSGDGPVVYTLDDHGRTVGSTTWSTDPAAAVDVESMAPAGPGEVWVGDTGDNTESRSSITVARVPVGRGDRTVAAPTFPLVYPDGAHDAETLIAGPDRLYVVTKWISGGRVYAAPRHLVAGRPNTLARVADVPGFITDGALLGRHRVLLRGYGSLTVYTFPGFRPLATYALPDQKQGESISVGPGHRVRIGSEGSDSPVLEITVPPTSATPQATPTPRDQSRRTPVTDDIEEHPWLPASGIVIVVLAVGGLIWWLQGGRKPRR